MQRVSTAFVGQVFAASSPAVAKLKGRARATNNSAYVPLASSQSRAVAPASRPWSRSSSTHRLSAVLLRADEVIESKSTRLTREHAHDIAPAVPALPSSRVGSCTVTTISSCVGLILRMRRSEADGQGNMRSTHGAQLNPHCGG